MSSRERRRAERRRRKRRSSERAVEGNGSTLAAGPSDAAGPAPIEDLAAEAERRGISRSELKNQRVREQLEPLAEGERPRIVTIGAVISALIALAIVAAWAAGAETRVFSSSGTQIGSERPSPLEVFPPALLFGVMAWGMWRARYWAVLGFQAVMAIIMVGGFLALITTESVGRALGILLVLLVAGTLFWFTVKGLARIQMPERRERP
jgi:hypothetical protein